MDYLLENIGQQLDEWFSRPTGAIEPDTGPDTGPDTDRDEGAVPPLDQPEMMDGSLAADEDDSPEGAALSGPKD